MSDHAHAPSADTITEEAEATTKLLDSASSQMQGIGGIDVSKHLEELKKIRGLVQKIRYQQDLQTRSVATALATLKGVAKKLDEVLGVRPEVLQEQTLNINNAMDELHEAGKNLRQQLPGDISSALRNEVSNGFQINATMGGESPEGRVITESVANKASSATQINAPVYGNPGWFEKLCVAQTQARAAR